MQSNIRSFQRDSRFPVLPAANEASDSSARKADSDLSIRLRQDLAGVFETVDNTLKEFERAKSSLYQRTVALDLERDAHHEIKSQHRLIAVEREKLMADLAALRLDHDRSRASLADLEDANADLQLSLTEKNRLISDLGHRGEAEREKIALLQAEAAAQSTHIETSDKDIFRLESQLTTSLDAIAIAEAEIQKRDAEIGELRHIHTRANRALEETEELLAGANVRMEEFAADLDCKHAEQLVTLGLLQAESDGRRDEVATLQMLHDAHAARAGDLDERNGALTGELNEARAALPAISAELTRWKAEADTAAQTAHALDLELAATRKRAEHSELAHTRASEKVEHLTQSLRSTEADNTAWRNKYEAVKDKLALEEQKYEHERAAFSQRLARLTGQVEQAQLARMLAESAHMTVKTEGVTLLRAKPIRMKQAVSEADAAAAAEDAAAPTTAD